MMATSSIRDYLATVASWTTVDQRRVDVLSHGRFAYDILALIFTRQNNKLS